MRLVCFVVDVIGEKLGERKGREKDRCIVYMDEELYGWMCLVILFLFFGFVK